MPFRFSIRVGPYHVLDGGPDPPMRIGNFEGRKGHPFVKYMDTLCGELCKTAERTQMPFGLWARMGQRNRVRWGSSGAEGCFFLWHPILGRNLLQLALCERQRLSDWLWRGFECSADRMQILLIYSAPKGRCMATIFGFLYTRCTLAPPGQCDWTVRVRRRCGLMSNYFDHLLLLLRYKTDI